MARRHDPLFQPHYPRRNLYDPEFREKRKDFPVGAAIGRPQRVKKALNIRCHSEPVRLSGVGIPRIEVKATGLGSKMFEN